MSQNFSVDRLATLFIILDLGIFEALRLLFV